MDNIQKLVLGVLSIAGAIAMLTPTDVDFAAKIGNASPAEGVPAPPPPQMTLVDEGEFTEEAIEPDDEEVQDDEEDVAFGQPLLDADAVGTQNQQNADNSWMQNVQSAPGYNYDYGQASTQSFNNGSGSFPTGGASPPDVAVPAIDVGQ